MRWLALTLVAIPFAAQAQTAPSVPAPDQTAQGDVSVTIYNNDLALVQDRRTLNLAAGRTRQEFADVSAAIRPETVTLNGSGITIVEQNFDYDLLTPTKLIEKAVGRQVHVIRTNPGTGAETRETATVLSANSGVILKIGNRITIGVDLELVQCFGYEGLDRRGPRRVFTGRRMHVHDQDRLACAAWFRKGIQVGQVKPGIAVGKTSVRAGIMVLHGSVSARATRYRSMKINALYDGVVDPNLSARNVRCCRSCAGRH